MILGKFKITYLERNIVQEKDLISHDDFVNIITPLKQELVVLEEAKEKDVDAISKIKQTLSVYGKNYFTTLSPFGLALETGKLDLSPYGIYDVKFEKL